MYRYLSLAVMGLALAAPQVSQAQTPVAVPVQPSPVVVYQPGPTYVAPGYVAPAPVVVAPPVVVRRPVYYPRYAGYRWAQYGRWGHYRYHR
jgi:hypothetical protein